MFPLEMSMNKFKHSRMPSTGSGIVPEYCPVITAQIAEVRKCSRRAFLSGSRKMSEPSLQN